MRTLFLELGRTEGNQPANMDDYTGRSTETVKSIIRRFGNFGFDEFVLAADDVFYRDDVMEIIDYTLQQPTTREVLVFTNGQFNDRQTGRAFATRHDVTPVIPVNFEHPTDDVVYGPNDFNEKFQYAVRRLPDVQIWQSVAERIAGPIPPVTELARELGVEWRGYLTDDPMPEDLVRRLQENDFQVAPTENWWFVHQDGEIPDVPVYQQDILQDREPYSGTIFVDADGLATSRHTEEEVPVHRLTREDLVEFALKQ